MSLMGGELTTMCDRASLPALAIGYWLLCIGLMSNTFRHSGAGRPIRRGGRPPSALMVEAHCVHCRAMRTEALGDAVRVAAHPYDAVTRSHGSRNNLCADPARCSCDTPYLPAHVNSFLLGQPLRWYRIERDLGFGRLPDQGSTRTLRLAGPGSRKRDAR
jgi:hypothetical protein